MLLDPIVPKEQVLQLVLFVQKVLTQQEQALNQHQNVQSAMKAITVKSELKYNVKLELIQIE